MTESKDKTQPAQSAEASTETASKNGKNEKDRWDKAKIVFEIIAKVAVPIVVLVLGWWTKGSVELALKEQQLEISSAQGMEDLISTLRKSNLQPHEADGAALALAAYGRHAIAPLISVLDGNTNARLAAEKSLFTIGLAHPKTTCDIIERSLNSHNEQFSLRGHKSVIKLLARVGCTGALGSLRLYEALIPDDSQAVRDAYARMMSDRSVDVESIVQIREELRNSIEILEQK